MTDLELTKLCAEAMGSTPFVKNNKTVWLLKIETSTFSDPSKTIPRYAMQYDPLHDDAQAMALVKKFSLGICSGNGWTVEMGDGDIFGYAPDLNRAIVECVAKMRAAKSA